ncbi:hypothetical protein EXIGLDRAFT_729344 [Exidia glandulosa HHB12029]|uniref:Uncharacterized protein n=1 Tax=Exidia glandulosa HHB12029 TaxID=1314781 RepID=A0A165ZHG2_EXIGL|nr:hypothetical protein EXIGLDRAFT_729344 [Exidia glandulosa HHB12029]
MGLNGGGATDTDVRTRKTTGFESAGRKSGEKGCSDATVAGAGAGTGRGGRALDSRGGTVTDCVVRIVLMLPEREGARDPLGLLARDNDIIPLSVDATSDMDVDAVDGRSLFRYVSENGLLRMDAEGVRGEYSDPRLCGGVDGGGSRVWKLDATLGEIGAVSTVMTGIMLMNDGRC